MNNTEELLKRVLLNMKYDSRKTLSEQIMGDEVTVSAKSSSNSKQTIRSFEGNPELKNRKIIDCKTGQQYISSNFTIESSFTPTSATEWFNSQNKLVEENKVNSLSACKYYVTILVDQQKRGVGDYSNITPPDPFKNNLSPDEFETQNNQFTNKLKTINYDDKVNECITSSFAAYNSKPVGCTTIFRYFSKYLEDQGNKDPFISVNYMKDSWFLTEYKKWEQNKDYTPKAPFLMDETAKYWSVYNGKRENVINIGDFNLDTSKDNLTQVSSNASDEFDITNELPLTNDEKMQMMDTPIDSSGEFKGGKYICKKPNVQFVNLRTGPGVNEDSGYFDPTDNFINWGGDEIVGKYITKQNQTPAKQQSSGTLGGTYKDESLVKFYKNLTNNDIKNIISHLEKKGMANKIFWKDTTIKDALSKKNTREGVLSMLVGSPNNKELLPEDVYKKLPGKFKSYTWYKVEFLKPVYDSHEGDSYKEGWVRSDNVKFCEKTTNANSETNYNNELLKRVPIKPLKDPMVK
jgi:hypothetical protein